MRFIKATQIYGRPFSATKESAQPSAAQNSLFAKWQKTYLSSWYLTSATPNIVVNVSTTCFWRVSWLKDLSGSKEKHLHFIIYLVTESFSVSSPQLYSGYMELHLRVVYLFDIINDMVECYGAQYKTSLLILNLQGFFSNLCGKDSMPASSNIG